MKKEDLLKIAQEAAKNIKIEHDLNALTQMLSKITIEAALNAELDEAPKSWCSSFVTMHAVS